MRKTKYLFNDDYPELHRQLESRELSPTHSFSSSELQELRDGKCFEFMWKLARKDALLTTSLLFGSLALGLASPQTLVLLLILGGAGIAYLVWLTQSTNQNQKFATPATPSTAAGYAPLGATALTSLDADRVTPADEEALSIIRSISP